MRFLFYALVVLAACGKPMERQAPRPELPPLPTQVISQLGPVPIVWVDSLSNVEGQQMLGGFHAIRRTIYIRRDVLKNPRVAWLVVFHEICHVWSLDSGVAAQIPPDVMQSVCDAQAAYRVAELIQSRSPSR